jgi:hypothetical protein
MTLAVHRWTRETLLARLAASDAIDAAADIDPTTAARERLQLLGIGDRFEAGAITCLEAVAEFDALVASASQVVAHTPAR